MGVFTLIRLFLYGWGIYVFYILAYPDWKGSPYHFIALTAIFFGAFALYIVLRALQLGTIVGTLLFELSFALAVLLAVGWTMPQRSGKPPIQLWAEGNRPNRSQAREGLERLGFDPDKSPARTVLSLFPKK